MPYKKNKKQTKRKVTKNVIQKKMMTARLILINLKVDDYVYKNKPISIEEANKYAREIETFRHLCRDERCLQVVEKLSSYMKFLIREQSTKDIEVVNVTHQIEPIKELHTGNENGTYTAGPECNNIDTEMEQSILDLSIVEPKDPLAISDINDNYHKKIKIQNSLSKLTDENLNEAYVNTNHTKKHIITESKIAKVNTINQNQTEIVDVSSIKSQNLLSNLEYDNYKSIQNYSKNKLTQHIFKDSANKTTIYNDMSTENNTNQSDINNQNDIKQKEQNLLNNLEQGKFAVLNAVKNNTRLNNNKLQHDNEINTNIKDKDIKYNNNNTENNNKYLKEDSKLNNINKNEIWSDSNMISSDILSNGLYRNCAVVIQNNENNQLHLVDYTPNDIANTRNKFVNNYTNKRNSNLNPVRQKEISEDSNKVSQNLLNHFESVNYSASVQNNTNTKKNQQHCDYERPNYIADAKNEVTIYSNMSKGIISRGENTRFIEISNPHTMKPKAIGENSTKLSQNTNATKYLNLLEYPTPIIEKQYTNNKDNANDDISQQINVRNGDATVLTKKNTVKNEATNTLKKRTYHRKKKVINVTTAQRDSNKKGIVNPTVQSRINSERTRKKNKRVYVKKKREVTDLSWVENVKFVRVIETEEYTKFDNFEESFWSDLTVPPNINLTDFEYDNINIWKT